MSDGVPSAVEIRSRGYLPLRVRTAEIPYRRSAFPGTAVVVGERTYEVVDERTEPERVVYSLREWPEGEVIRDRVEYGPRFVRAVLAERERAATRARFRPYRAFLYPIVGLLPEAEQERWSERLGLYSVTATLVSGACEVALLLLAVWAIGRGGDDPGLRVMLALAAPLLAILALLGFGRAFAALAFRETSGQYLVELAFSLFRSARAAVAPRDRTLVPLTRDAFWARLMVPDRVAEDGHGTLVLRGLLPHLGWETGHHVEAGDLYFRAEPEPPVLDRGRLVYTYRLTPAREEPMAPPAALSTVYARKVWAGIEKEWDDFLTAFTWFASLLPEDVQRRAFESRGGPACVRRTVQVTAVVGFVVAAYIFAQPVVPADPVGPWLRLVAVGLVVDGARRLQRARRGSYAPSVFSFLLPCDSLRPERIAYHAHRDAERAARRVS